MKCPQCNVDLSMTDRQGIEIDYCPQCRGVWLDRGELDKIIERSVPADGQTNVQPAPQPPQHPQYREEYRHERHHDSGHHDYDHKKHKKESFLGDLFDF